MRLLHAALIFENLGDEIDWFAHFNASQFFAKKLAFFFYNSMSWWMPTRHCIQLWINWRLLNFYRMWTERIWISVRSSAFFVWRRGCVQSYASRAEYWSIFWRFIANEEFTSGHEFILGHQCYSVAVLQFMEDELRQATRQAIVCLLLYCCTVFREFWSLYTT